MFNRKVSSTTFIQKSRINPNPNLNSNLNPRVEVLRFYNEKSRDHYFQVMTKPQGFMFEKHEEIDFFQILIISNHRRRCK